MSAAQWWLLGAIVFLLVLRDGVLPALRRRPWRAGWAGRLLRLHSPSAEAHGACWCQR